jgi:hypothetical protein
LFIDSLTFNEQTSDVSSGRYPDGSSNWQFFLTPSPGDSNANPSDISKQLERPLTFILSQNYPNPFNPVTMIDYQLPMTCEVELSIYNLLGQKVKTLVSKKQPAGYYKVAWDGSGFGSGVYFYRLSAKNEVKNFSQIKKLVLLK